MNFTIRKITDKSRIFRHYFLFSAIALPIYLSLVQTAIADPVEQLLETRACPECELGSANLVEAKLNGANLSLAKLRGANFQKANLIGANLIGAYLKDANFQDANLRWANFTNADLENVDFRGADLRGAKFNAALLKDVNSQKSIFCRTIMSDGKLNNRDCRLSGD
ncbi:MAG: pentapeptide repeat-containing protein [Pseudanabaena frigida]|uniref:Pentapeptide repeat-containing protein n=1 Tax=Pseudanabaena frigida TaxID=945775 RepID=A0A2W4W0P2_9CYAN|nr:MAG: pentapeptide repeat-containing protein [Pseudanabaena frigida]